MQFMPLPGYQGGRPLDFSGITGAFDSAQRNALAQAKLDLDREQFGLTKRQADEVYARQQARDEAWAKMKGDPRVWAALPRGAAPFVEAAGAEQGPQLAANALLNHANMDMQRQHLALQNKLAEANLQQVKMQTPEWRQANAARFGIDTNSESGRAWVVTGTYSPPGPMDELLRGIAKDARAGTAPSGPAIGQQPRVVPQSFDGGMVSSDPNLIRVQTNSLAPRSGGPASAVETPLGQMTPDNAKRLGFGLALGGRGEAGKMMLEDVNRFELGKEAKDKLDQQQVQHLESLQNIRNIRSSFRPEFLTAPFQGKMWGAALQEKFATLPPETQRQLYGYTTFRADAARNVNIAVKNASGATVTEQELRRNLAELPNAGTGMFDGDAPTAFRAKLDRAEETLALGLARQNYLRANGFKGNLDQAANLVPIEKMREVLQQRTDAIARELMAARPNADPTMLQREIGARLNKEFGI